MKLKRTIPLLGIAIALIAISITVAPLAYSSGGSNDDHDDDCKDDKHSKYNDDDCKPDPCDCEKPDTFTVSYNGPGTETNPAIIEIYKKSDYIGTKEPLDVIKDVYNENNEVVVSASNFNKNKMPSNTVYRIGIDNNANNEFDQDEEIAIISIHTSCSKPLFVGDIHIANEGTPDEVTLTVVSGKRGERETIPTLTCEEDQKPTNPATITLINALTSDTGGEITDPNDSAFGLTVSPANTQVSFGAIIEVPAKEPISIDATIPEGYTRVLITGKNCPESLPATVSLKEGKNLTCTIYHDDNDLKGTNGVPAGTIFWHNSLNFKLMNDEGENCNTLSDTAEVVACVETVEAGDQIFLIVDENLSSGTTIVLFSMVEDGKLPVTAASVPVCTMIGIEPHDGLSPMNPTGKLGFKLSCANLQNNLSYNINYAMIETEG